MTNHGKSVGVRASLLHRLRRQQAMQCPCRLQPRSGPRRRWQPGGRRSAAAPTGITINAPTVGTFYSAASPEDAPFVTVGTVVKPDTVICMIEAMKVFNQILAEKSGRIVEILVENGDAVGFGQPLFRIEPA